MSFFKTLKRAFGFGSDDEYEEYEVDDVAVDNNYNSSDEPETLSPQPPAKAAVDVENIDFPLTVFDSLLEVFNNAQPDFIKNCIDIEAQRKFLYDSLDGSFKEYIEGIKSRLRQEGDSRIAQDRETLQAEIGKLQSRCAAVEGKEEQWTQQRLSADRQKRALTDKVQELERRILELQAENEQYQLENKSLVNKVKASGVRENDLVEMRGQMDAMRQQLEKSKSENSNTELQEENTRLISALERVEAELKEKQNDIQDLNRRITSMNVSSAMREAEVASLKKEVEKEVKERESKEELFKTRMSMSDNMINDLRNRLAQSRHEMEEHVNANNEINERYRSTLEELEACREELKEANDNLEIAADVQDKIEQCEAIINRRNERISALKAEKESMTDQIARLEKENETLKTTIERNLHDRAASETELRNEIEALKRVSEEAAATTPVNDKTRRRKKAPKISAIDESLNDTEWLIATPPEGVVAKATGVSSDSDFGYQEPQRKSAPDNSAQMSLF